MTTENPVIVQTKDKLKQLVKSTAKPTPPAPPSPPAGPQKKG